MAESPTATCMGTCGTLALNFFCIEQNFRSSLLGAGANGICAMADASDDIVGVVDDEAPGEIQATCSSDANCHSGFICAQGGLVAGTCTTECETHDECRLRHGDSFGCISGSCVEYCAAGTCSNAYPGTCPSNRRCQPWLSSGCAQAPSVCVR
jgi:hypothetical protein